MANWKFNGKNVTPRALAKLLRDEEEKKAADAALFAARELNKYIDQLNATSSMRGDQADTLAGKHIVGSQFYNQPLRGAKVAITRRRDGNRTTFRIAVEHKNHRGVNIFDLLDEGAPDRDGEEMTFPIYSGRRTGVAGRRGGPSISSTPARLGKPLAFIKTSFVKGFPPRNFYRTVADRVRIKFYPGVRDVTFRVGDKKV